MAPPRRVVPSGLLGPPFTVLLAVVIPFRVKDLARTTVNQRATLRFDQPAFPSLGNQEIRDAGRHR